MGSGDELGFRWSALGIYVPVLAFMGRQSPVSMIACQHGCTLLDAYSYAVKPSSDADLSPDSMIA